MIFSRQVRLHRIAQNVMAIDRRIAAVQHIALPATNEHPLRRPAFIAAIFVNRSPTLGRPANDLDVDGIRRADQRSVAGQILGRRVHHRNRNPP